MSELLLTLSLTLNVIAIFAFFFVRDAAKALQREEKYTPLQFLAVLHNVCGRNTAVDDSWDAHTDSTIEKEMWDYFGVDRGDHVDEWVAVPPKKERS